LRRFKDVGTAVGFDEVSGWVLRLTNDGRLRPVYVRVRVSSTVKGWMVGWGLTAFSAQTGYIVPWES